MIDLTIIRNSALATAFSLLLLAGFLHPVFHNHDTHSIPKSKCLNDDEPCLQDDTDAECPCPICSSLFLKYHAGNSILIASCSYHSTAVLSPLDFVILKINFNGSPRAPPDVFS